MKINKRYILIILSLILITIFCFILSSCKKKEQILTRQYFKEYDYEIDVSEYIKYFDKFDKDELNILDNKTIKTENDPYLWWITNMQNDTIIMIKQYNNTEAAAAEYELNLFGFMLETFELKTIISIRKSNVIIEVHSNDCNYKDEEWAIDFLTAYNIEIPEPYKIDKYPSNEQKNILIDKEKIEKFCAENNYSLYKQIDDDISRYCLVDNNGVKRYYIDFKAQDDPRITQNDYYFIDCDNAVLITNDSKWEKTLRKICE